MADGIILAFIPSSECELEDIFTTFSVFSTSCLRFHLLFSDCDHQSWILSNFSYIHRLNFPRRVITHSRNDQCYFPLQPCLHGPDMSKGTSVILPQFVVHLSTDKFFLHPQVYLATVRSHILLSLMFAELEVGQWVLIESKLE
jgi:hypothetical protein